MIFDAFGFLCQFLFLAAFFSLFLVEFVFDALFGRKGKEAKVHFVCFCVSLYIFKQIIEQDNNYIMLVKVCMEDTGICECTV